MSKEVEEAIETLKCMRLYFSDCEVCTDNDCDKKPCDNLKAIAIVLNYIKKLNFKYQARKDKYETKIKKLEAKIKRYERYLDNKDKKFKEALENEYQERETDYIPKQVIRDKIEEIEKRNYNDYTREQDGNEVKYSILKDFKCLLEEE